MLYTFSVITPDNHWERALTPSFPVDLNNCYIQFIQFTITKLIWLYLDIIVIKPNII
jgi:hypothetical protein